MQNPTALRLIKVDSRLLPSKPPFLPSVFIMFVLAAILALSLLPGAFAGKIKFNAHRVKNNKGLSNLAVSNTTSSQGSIVIDGIQDVVYVANITIGGHGTSLIVRSTASRLDILSLCRLPSATRHWIERLMGCCNSPSHWRSLHGVYLMKHFIYY